MSKSSMSAWCGRCSSRFLRTITFIFIVATTIVLCSPPEFDGKTSCLKQHQVGTNQKAFLLLVSFHSTRQFSRLLWEMCHQQFHPTVSPMKHNNGSMASYAHGSRWSMNAMVRAKCILIVYVRPVPLGETDACVL